MKSRIRELLDLKVRVMLVRLTNGNEQTMAALCLSFGVVHWLAATLLQPIIAVPSCGSSISYYMLNSTAMFLGWTGLGYFLKKYSDLVYRGWSVLSSIFLNLFGLLYVLVVFVMAAVALLGWLF